MPYYNCRKLCLQMSATIIFETSQNNIWLVYIIGTFFRLVVWFDYGQVVLLFFKVRYQNNCYQVLNVVNTCEDKKRRQIVLVLKYYLGKLDIKPK